MRARGRIGHNPKYFSMPIHKNFFFYTFLVLAVVVGALALRAAHALTLPSRPFPEELPAGTLRLEGIDISQGVNSHVDVDGALYRYPESGEVYLTIDNNFFVRSGGSYINLNPAGNTYFDNVAGVAIGATDPAGYKLRVAGDVGIGNRQFVGGRLYLSNSAWHNWGTSVIDGRVWSANDNIHLSPPGGKAVYINDDYRDAGGGTGEISLRLAGFVGVGTTDTHGYRLYINGGLRTTYLKVPYILMSVDTLPSSCPSLGAFAYKRASTASNEDGYLYSCLVSDLKWRKIGTY